MRRPKCDGQYIHRSMGDNYKSGDSANPSPSDAKTTDHAVDPPFTAELFPLS
jgi:hypothetical protein